MLLVCGNVNVETVFHLAEETLPVQGGFFPHQLSLNVSGVGANLTRALTALGSQVRLLSFAAHDEAGKLIRTSFSQMSVEAHFAATGHTPLSLALVGPDGQHTFHRDLKDTPQAAAPVHAFESLCSGCSATILTNIGWTRDLLPIARAASLPILVDVQDIPGPDDPYNAPYFAAADVLFLSAARLRDPAATLRELSTRFPARLLVAGLGEQGALLLERGQDVQHQPAFPVDAVYYGGAGDTLAAGFAHFFFTRQMSAPQALRLACAAAALKLRIRGSGQGHPTEAEVLQFAR